MSLVFGVLGLRLVAKLAALWNQRKKEKKEKPLRYVEWSFTIRIPWRIK